jgi:hypothetical protein
MAAPCLLLDGAEEDTFPPKAGHCLPPIASSSPAFPTGGIWAQVNPSGSNRLGTDLALNLNTGRSAFLAFRVMVFASIFANCL